MLLTLLSTWRHSWYKPTLLFSGVPMLTQRVEGETPSTVTTHVSSLVVSHVMITAKRSKKACWKLAKSRPAAKLPGKAKSSPPPSTHPCSDVSANTPVCSTPLSRRLAALDTGILRNMCVTRITCRVTRSWKGPGNSVWTASTTFGLHKENFSFFKKETSQEDSDIKVQISSTSTSPRKRNTRARKCQQTSKGRRTFSLIFPRRCSPDS